MQRILGPTVVDPQRGCAEVGPDSTSSNVAPTVQAESLDVDLDGHPVLRDLSLEVAPGEVVGITGRNGSGKSTLLRVLATLVVPARGRLRVLGETVTGASMLPPEKRGHLALVGHRPALHPHRTVAEELELVCSIRAAAGWPSRRRVSDGLEFVGLWAARARRVGDCSQGMRRRADLARAWLGAPQLLLLDEPDAGLDAAATACIDGLVDDVRGRSGGVVVVGHDVATLSLACDRVLWLSGGRLSQVMP